MKMTMVNSGSKGRKEHIELSLVAFLLKVRISKSGRMLVRFWVNIPQHKTNALLFPLKSYSDKCSIMIIDTSAANLSLQLK